MGQVSPDSTTSASRNQVQQLKDTIFIGIVNGESVSQERKYRADRAANKNDLWKT